jgi:hypothetical protein
MAIKKEDSEAGEAVEAAEVDEAVVEEVVEKKAGEEEDIAAAAAGKESEAMEADTGGRAPGCRQKRC